MPTYTFFGKVFPERAHMGFRMKPILFGNSLANYSGELPKYSGRLSIALSQISAVVTSENEIQDTDSFEKPGGILRQIYC